MSATKQMKDIIIFYFALLIQISSSCRTRYLVLSEFSLVVVSAPGMVVQSLLGALYHFLLFVAENLIFSSVSKEK